MQREQQILKILKQTYPKAKCALVHRSAWQLLVSTILSAQCTDVRVNKVTKVLFANYPTVAAIYKLNISTLKKLIRTTGFYNNKAKNIKATAKIIVEEHQGKVPSNMEQMLELPGVARKTANVVLSVWFRKNEGVVVDTHVKRISVRLGLTAQNRPEKVEDDLMKLYAKQDWERIAALMIHHGRNICKARIPQCTGCPLNKLCPSAFQFDKYV